MPTELPPRTRPPKGSGRTARRSAVEAAGAAAVLGLLLSVAGCGDDGGGRFDTQGGDYPVKCLVHQTDPPGRDYTAGQAADTAAVLAMLRYYAANEKVPYCDGKAATKTDREWAELFVRLGADPQYVKHILS